MRDIVCLDARTVSATRQARPSGLGSGIRRQPTRADGSHQHVSLGFSFRVQRLEPRRALHSPSASRRSGHLSTGHPHVWLLLSKATLLQEIVGRIGLSQPEAARVGVCRRRNGIPWAPRNAKEPRISRSGPFCSVLNQPARSLNGSTPEDVLVVDADLWKPACHSSSLGPIPRQGAASRSRTWMHSRSRSVRSSSAS
jgi:hypothetical protein